MPDLEQRKAELLAIGLRLMPTPTDEFDEVEEGEWIGNDGHALSVKQLDRLDTRGYNQLKREFLHHMKSHA